MRVKVISVGKLKERFLKEGIGEYVKRLGRFAKLELIELTDEKTPDKASESENQQILKKEAERILPKISDREFVIALVIEGKQLNSQEFSQLISDTAMRGFSDITFIIGGSLGLHSTVKNRANAGVSFGNMTFPHQLMRLILMEQIYRAFMIQQGSPYHK